MSDRRRRRGWAVIGPGTATIGPGTGQWQWRGLFEDLLAYQGDDWAGEVIDPWAQQHPGVIAELHAIGAPGNHRARVTWRRGEFSALEGLYALGRVLDVLAAPYQPVNRDPALLSWINGRPWWTGRIPDRGALPAFADAVGAARISEETFHPFFHEISAVEPASDPGAPVELIAEVWPGYLAGGLLLARAGVIVRAGSAALDPEVTARSCLYWAWWRRNRTTADLSHGWGANSQWGTDFRRDYIADGQLHYNVDGYKNQPSASAGDLSGAVARELLRHRCSTRDDLGRDRWPWHLTLTEPAP
jgi:hypothetical protein